MTSHTRRQDKSWCCTRVILIVTWLTIMTGLPVAAASPLAQTKEQLVREVAAVVPDLPLYAQSDAGLSGQPPELPLKDYQFSLGYKVEDATSAVPAAFMPSTLPPSMDVYWMIEAGWLELRRSSAQVAQAFQQNVANSCGQNFVTGPYGENSCLRAEAWSGNQPGSFTSLGKILVTTPCATVHVDVSFSLDAAVLTPDSADDLTTSINSVKETMRVAAEKYVQEVAAVLMAPVNAACGLPSPAAQPSATQPPAQPDLNAPSGTARIKQPSGTTTLKPGGKKSSRSIQPAAPKSRRSVRMSLTASDC